MSLGFRIYKALCLKQIAISSLLYCSILVQGPSSSFFFSFILIRMISPFTEVNLQFIFINITSPSGFPVSQVSHQGPTLGSHLRVSPQCTTLWPNSRVPPQGSILGLHPVPHQGPTLGFHLRILCLGSHFSSIPQKQ